MPTNAMGRFYLILLVCVAVFGCSQEQQMLKPVMMAVVDEPASEELPKSPEMPAYSQYDVNLDGSVDNTDLQLVTLAMDETQFVNSKLDVNSDGIIDRIDLELIYENIDPQDREPIEEKPPLEIPFDLSDVELPPIGSVPTGVEVLETDEVFHFTAEGFAEERQNWLGTFDTAEAAIHADPVADFFESVKASLADCDSGDVSFLPEVYLLFTSRAERGKFKQALPGGFITTVHEYPPENDKRWKNWWEISVEPVLIVDSKDAYFGVGVYPNNPCKNFR